MAVFLAGATGTTRRKKRGNGAGKRTNPSPRPRKNAGNPSTVHAHPTQILQALCPDDVTGRTTLRRGSLHSSTSHGLLGPLSRKRICFPGLISFLSRGGSPRLPLFPRLPPFFEWNRRFRGRWVRRLSVHHDGYSQRGGGERSHPRCYRGGKRWRWRSGPWRGRVETKQGRTAMAAQDVRVKRRKKRARQGNTAVASSETRPDRHAPSRPPNLAATPPRVVRRSLVWSVRHVQAEPFLSPFPTHVQVASTFPTHPFARRFARSSSDARASTRVCHRPFVVLCPFYRSLLSRFETIDRKESLPGSLGFDTKRSEELRQGASPRRGRSVLFAEIHRVHVPILCGSRRMVRVFHVLWGCEAKHEAGVGGACCACCARTSRVACLPGAMAAPAQAPVVMKEAMLVRANRRTGEKRTRERMDGKDEWKKTRETAWRRDA